MRCAAAGAVMHHRIAFGDQPNRECGRKRGDGNEWADSDSMNNMHCVNCVCVVHRPSGWFVFFSLLLLSISSSLICRSINCAINIFCAHERV